MSREQTKVGVAWGLIAVAAVAMTTTLRGNYRIGPMIPQLVPLFGVAFAVLFLVAQAAFCALLDMKKGLIWLGAMFAVGFVAGFLGQGVFAGETGEYDWFRHKMVAGACFSGLAIGVQILRQKL